MSSVLFVRLTHKMKGFEYLLASIFYPSSVTLFIWPVLAFWISFGTVTKRDRTFPLYRFAIIAIFSVANNLLTALPGPYVDGPLQVILQRALLPFTMVGSYIVLKTRYQWNHYLGVLILLGGVLLEVWEKLTDITIENHTFWICLFFCASIPKAASFILKEKWIKASGVNILYFQGWDSIFEIFAGVLLFPTIFIPYPNQNHVNITQASSYIVDGVLCFCGVDSEYSSGNCDFTIAVYLFFLVMNLIKILSALLLIKYISAAVSAVASTCVVPVSSILYLIPYIAGEAAVIKISWFTVFSIFFVCLGMLVYRIKAEKSDYRVKSLLNEVEEDYVKV
eukprot:TRINITY_DN10645_c0_g1_i1.p1 TRINITY_DN10645_c0_g1~~TRINITY_DN10645_c0_g1_i1.p1  ORF type:complete len:391 (-),score=10.44 TRINITY_DN10645_c0_g1_i1:97-1104(-)